VNRPDYVPVSARPDADMPAVEGRRTRVLIPLSESLAGAMSAVGIRKYEVGRALAATCDVTFGTIADSGAAGQHGRVEPIRSRADLRRLLATHDVLYTLGLQSGTFLDVVRSRIRVVLDLYTPLAFEILESWPEVPVRLLAPMHRRIVRWTNAQIALADFVVCPGEAQRDQWLGAMNAAGVLTAEMSRRNPDCRDYIDVMPFGLPEATPQADGRPLRDAFPAIMPEDFVFLWSSKILAWQDPTTLLNAMACLRDRAPTIKLVFLGVGRRPSTERVDWFDPAAARTRQAFETADRLSLTGNTVFFFEDRVPYCDLGRYYRDADAAVATYPRSLETHFCIGSRLYDYLWAGLPMVISGLAAQAEFVERQGLGIVVPPEEVEALAEALLRLKDLVSTRAIRQNDIAAARDRYRWSTVVGPLARYCATPQARTRKHRIHAIRRMTDLLEFAARSAWCRGLRTVIHPGGVA